AGAGFFFRRAKCRLLDAQLLIHFPLQGEIENFRRGHRLAQLQYFGVRAQKILDLLVGRQAVGGERRLGEPVGLERDRQLDVEIFRQHFRRAALVFQQVALRAREGAQNALHQIALFAQPFFRKGKPVLQIGQVVEGAAVNSQFKLVARQNDGGRRERRELDRAAQKTLQLRGHVAAYDDRDVFVRIEAGLLQKPERGEVLRAAERRGAESLALELAQGFDLGPGDEPEKIFLETLGDDLRWQVAALERADHRADVVDRVRLAAQKRGDADVAAHLHHVGQKIFLAKKAALLGDVKIHRGDTAARVSDDDALGRLLRFGGAEKSAAQRNHGGEPPRPFDHPAFHRHPMLSGFGVDVKRGKENRSGALRFGCPLKPRAQLQYINPNREGRT